MPINIPASLRQLVYQRAAGCCEYCRVHQDDVPESHEIDHIVARRHGGQTISENLALACLQCNRSKAADLTGIDSETRSLASLFNPRTQTWHDHFESSGAQILGRTPTGRVTVALLRFNTPVRVDNRRLLIEKKRYPPQQNLPPK
jgi:hypothetical protein